MKTIQIDRKKTLVDVILMEIQNGEEVTLTVGENHSKVAIVYPLPSSTKTASIRLGLLEGKGVCVKSKIIFP